MSIKVHAEVASGDFVAVGAKIRNIRKLRKLTLQQVANTVGTDTGNLSRMERGQQGISLKMMSKLGDALGCSPDLFWRDAGDLKGYQSMVAMAERVPHADFSFGPQNRTDYKVTDSEVQLIDDFRDLDEVQAKELARQVHEQAQMIRAKRLLADERGWLRYMKDPRVQALLAEIEQKENK